MKTPPKTPSNYPTETKPKRYEFWADAETFDILENLEPNRSGSKADYINRCIVGYTALTEGEAMPLISTALIDELVNKLGSKIVKALRRDLEIG